MRMKDILIEEQQVAWEIDDYLRIYQELRDEEEWIRFNRVEPDLQNLDQLLGPDLEFINLLEEVLE